MFSYALTTRSYDQTLKIIFHGQIKFKKYILMSKTSYLIRSTLETIELKQEKR